MARLPLNNYEQTNMNIKDHPDFKVTETVEVCPNCDEPTVFKSGIRHNAPNLPPTYHECQSCGYDEEIGGVAEIEDEYEDD